MPLAQSDDIVVTARRFDPLPTADPHIRVDIEAIMASMAAITTSMAEAQNMYGRMLLASLKIGYKQEKIGKYFGKDFSDLSLYDDFTLGGHKIKIYFDNKSLNDDQKAAILQRIANGGMNFNMQTYGNASAVANSAKAYMAALDTIIFTDNIGRSGTYLSEKTFVFGYKDQTLDSMSQGFFMSTLMHDAFHAWSYEHGQPSYGIDAEIAATKAQVDTAAIFGLSTFELNYLISYMNNPAAMEERITTPWKGEP